MSGRIRFLCWLFLSQPVREHAAAIPVPTFTAGSPPTSRNDTTPTCDNCPTEVTDYGLTEVRDYDSTNAPDYDFTDASDCDSTDVPDYDFTDASDCDSTDVPDYDSTDAPDYESTYAPDYGLTEVLSYYLTEDTDNGTTNFSGYGEELTELDPDIMAQITHLSNLALIITLGCYIPILIFGLFGNTTSFVLLIKRTNNSSTYTYLCSLAIFDNISLISSMGNWILYSATKGDIDLRQILDCNLISALLYISKQTSAWLVVAVSVERVLVIYMPTKARSITNVTRTRAVTCLILLMMTVLNWQAFGTYETVKGNVRSETNVCSGRTPWLVYYNTIIQGWMDFTVYACIPTICLIVLNGAIIAKFTAAARNNKVNPNITPAMTKISRKMTMMGLTLSGTFLVLTLPHTIHSLFSRASSDTAVTDPVGYFTNFLISQILSILYRTNHAINMALYCMTNTDFRKELRSKFICQ